MNSIDLDVINATKQSEYRGVLQASRAALSSNRGAAARTTLLPRRVDFVLFRVAASGLVQDMEALRGLATAASDVSGPHDPEIALLDFSDRTDPEESAEAWLRASGRVLLHSDAVRPFAWALARTAPDETLWLQAYHPAALDPSAQDLVAARVIEAYAALVEGRPVPPSQGRLSCTSLQREDTSADRAWWEAQLRDPPPSLSAALPRRSPATGAASAHQPGDTVRHSIDAEIARQLSGIAQALGVSRPQLLCAAWTALLHRLAYQDDLLLGLAVSGRSHAARQRLDWLARVVPLRLRVAEDERFGDLARRVAGQMRAALRHQHGAVSQGQETARLQAVALEPLAVVFNHLPRRPAMKLGGLSAVTRTLDLGLGLSHDLVLSVEDGSDGAFALLLDGNPDDHRPDEVARLMRRLTLLLDNLTMAGETAAALRIADLTIMDANERQLVTDRFPHGPPAPPRRTLIEMLAGRLPQDAQAPALVAVSPGGTVRLSWGELDARSNRLARHLLAVGLSPGDTVAVLLPRNETLIVALLACAKAGIAYCPLDLAQPASRLAYLARACEARRLLTDMQAAPQLETAIEALLIDDPATRASIDARRGAALSDADRGAAVGPDTIAYVIFTSGSTGVPKGVAIPHGAIGQSAQAFAAEMEMRPGQALIMVISIAFDPATLHIFSGLSSGALLVLLDDVMRSDPAHVAAAVEKFQPAILDASPSVWRSLPIEAFPDTLAAVVGGEAFPAELVSRMQNLGSVTNAYGPTETAVVCAIHKLGSQDEWARPVPVGRPIAGYQTWIVDRGRQPVPVGALGELWIGGPAVAARYVRQPAQTEAAFLPSPYGPGSIYRTGDLARWRADGCIEVLGRIDQQVKLRGHRIELGEIEHVLRSLPGISDAAVVVRGDGPDARLVAYTVSDPDAIIPAPAELRAALAEQLPNWMVPDGFLRLPMLPRTISGKLDRSALPEAPSAHEANVAATPARAPRTPDEALLTQLFARLTGYAGVTADSDFFQIGGDSLRAMILVTELRQHGRSLPLASLYSERTPAAIAAIWSRDVPNKAEATRLTLFVIPGCGGDDPRLAAFRVDASDIFDWVVLEYPDWLHFASAEFDFNHVVASMADQIRAYLPSVPLLLAGYSMGSLIAWAVGRRLEEQGYPPDLLCLIDPSLTKPDDALAKHTYLAISAFSFSKFFRSLRAQGIPGLLGDLTSVLIRSSASLMLKRRHLLRRVARLRRLRLPARMRFDLRHFITTELHRETVDHWRLAQFSGPTKGYGGKATLFHASDRPSNAIDFNWIEYCSNLALQTVEGNHWSILQARGAGSLSAKLREVANNVSAGNSADAG